MVVMVKFEPLSSNSANKSIKFVLLLGRFNLCIDSGSYKHELLGPMYREHPYTDTFTNS